MTRAELANAIREDLKDRTTWDTRQANFYRMRTHGLRRTNKPWPNASDVHFPLCDTAIERLKPHYLQQAYSHETIATFEPDSQTAELHVSTAAQWFDYQLRHRSNIERELLRAIDTMLVGGRGILKQWWDDEKKRLVYSAVRPQMLIVPHWTQSLDDADRICHVTHWSKEGYERNPKFKKGLAGRLCGGGIDSADDPEVETRQARTQREGLTYTSEDLIVLWEVWTPDPDGGWKCDTISPVEPDANIRPSYKSPFPEGSHPFTAFAIEECEDGWFSARGIVELLAAFEAEACKILNEKNDAMTLFNKPMFRSERDGANTGNLVSRPGQILPYGIAPVQMPNPPVSFDQQLLLIRDLGERRVNVPDFGMSQLRNTQDSRTATEIQAIGATSAMSNDLRMRVFRMGLAECYAKSWGLLRINATDQLGFWVEGAERNLSPEVFTAVFKVRPSGSADGTDRNLQLTKAWNRLTQFRGDPFIDQSELRKSVLEADDPGLAKRLYMDPQLGELTQSEEQAVEIGVLRLGFPAAVLPTDNHAAHIRTILSYIKQQSDNKEEPKQAETLNIMAHLEQHLQMLAKQDPQQAKAAQDAIAVVLEGMQAQGQEQEGGANVPA